MIFPTKQKQNGQRKSRKTQVERRTIYRNGFFRVAVVLTVTVAQGFRACDLFAVCTEVIDAILYCRVLS
jgi:hypothetical protein